MIINATFIAEWHPRYDECTHDEGEYQAILSNLAPRLPTFKNMPRLIVRRIIRWKSPRIMSRVNYGILAKAVHEAAGYPELCRLAILDAGPFVGAPFASTILHFMYPDRFPIFDIRTATALHTAGLFSTTSIAAQHYSAFVKAIFDIQHGAPWYSLRQIDQVLFAFQKLTLVPRKSS